MKGEDPCSLYRGFWIRAMQLAHPKPCGGKSLKAVGPSHWIMTGEILRGVGTLG